MEKKVRLKPETGKTVPDPERGDNLPQGGRSVAMNAYWRRCLADGDVVIVVDEPKASAKGKGASK